MFPLQYICRNMDMSTLTSWRWVFAEQGMPGTFLLLIAGVIAALPISALELPERYTAGFLFILALLCCLSFWDSPEYLLDTSRYFLQAKYMKVHGFGAFFREWGKGITPWTDLPLVPLIYGILFKVFGETRSVIVVFNTLLFSFIPVMTYFSGKLLWDHATGLLAGLLLLASPYLLTQVPLMLVDIHTIFFLLLAVCIFLYALEKGGIFWLLASSFSIILALMTKYSTWPMLGVLGIVILVKLGAQPGVILRRALAVALLTGLFLGGILFWMGDVIREQINVLRTYQLSGLKKWQEGYIAAIFFQAHPFILIAVLLGIYRAVRIREKKILIIIWFLVLVFLLELKRLRYLLPLVPFFSLAAAFGLQMIPDVRVRRYIVYCTIMWSLVIGSWIYRPFLAGTSMSNLQQAGKFLDTLDSPAVEVYCLSQVKSVGNTSVAVPILDLYTGKDIFQSQSWNSDKGFLKAKDTSLRFTWELTRPDYYRQLRYNDMKLPLVILSSEPGVRIPPELNGKYPAPRVAREFVKTSGIFRYQIYVTVFYPS